MNAEFRAGHAVRRHLLALAAAAAVLALEPAMAGATLLSSYGTGAQTGGFTSHTSATRSASVQVDSDVSIGSYNEPYNDTQYNATWASLSHVVTHCYTGGSFSVYSQHAVFDPSNNEYESASSGADGNCP
jgi:hypothetical protein